MKPTHFRARRRGLALLFSVAGLASTLAACGGSSNNPRALPPGPTPAPAPSTALQFFGTGSGDIDRVKIRLTNSNTNASLPVNVGATDFTLEFWIKGNGADNVSAQCGAGVAQPRDDWMTGNILFDRDVNGNGDFGEYGISLRSGRIAFGVSRNGFGATLCGQRSVLDGNWNHVAVTRQANSGEMRIFVNGALDATITSANSNQEVSYNPAHPTPANNDPFLVIGAGKFDTGLLAFRGLLDEVRLSAGAPGGVRYTGNFTPSATPFIVDGNTAALYHFDESASDQAALNIIDAVGSSPGTRRVGGANDGPAYVADTPL